MKKQQKLAAFGQQLTLDLSKEFTDFGLYCGLGGMALGTARTLVRMGGYVGRFRCLGGIDSNPKACRNFERLTGISATCLDLFDREQYIDWHGHEPPSDWHEATPEDVLAAAGGEYPTLVESSPPCKGLSGLLSGTKSRSKKYQALNHLTVRGVFLMLEAFKKDLPAVFFFENVPRIQTRGADLLATMKGMLEAYGYAVHCGVHNAGKLFGGGQNRIRFFMIARLVAKVPKLIYKPRELPLQSIGDVLSKLPWPGDIARGGAMHRLPNISMTTALRLACIRPGHDWRDLQGDLTNIKLAHDARQGAWLVSRWSDPARTITGAKGIGTSNSPQAVAQPLDESLRIDADENRHPSGYNVQGWDRHARTITGVQSLSGGAPSLQDVRVGEAGWFDGAYDVEPFDRAADCVITGSSPSASAPVVQNIRVDADGKWTGHALRVTAEDAPSPCVTSADGPSCGAVCVAQNLRRREASGSFGESPGLMGVNQWDDAAPTVSCKAGVSQGNMPAAVGDIRVDLPKLEDIARREGLGANFAGAPGLMGVIAYDEAAPTVSGSAAVTSSNMPASVQDIAIRSDENRHTNHMAVNPWCDAAGTVTGATHCANGAPSVQDTRLEYEPRGGGPFGVMDWEEAGATVLANSSVRGSNAAAVQDERIDLSSVRLPDNEDRHSSKYRVQPHDEPSTTVTTSDRIGSGAPAVQDVRLPHRDNRFKGKYFVQPSDKPARTVTGGVDPNTNGLSVQQPIDLASLVVGSESDRRFNHVYNVTPWDQPSGTVASGSGPGAGAISIQDLRLGCTPRGDSKGPLGVTPWGDPSPTVTASGDLWTTAAALQDVWEWHLPVVQPGFHYIFTEDEPGQWSWHRPLTTLDLAALQDLLIELIRAGGGVPLALEGSDKERREQIGNAVPPGAMHFISTVIMYSLMKGQMQDESVASDEVWVQDDLFIDWTQPLELDSVQMM